MRYLIAFLLMVSLPVHGQALWRNFFSTNQNPRVTVVAGSNATVQASTVGVDQRIFTVNSVPPTNVAFAGYATNSGFATNANFATNASNATNLWGVLNPTNIPSLNYISNNAGFGTNTTIFGTLNASNVAATGVITGNGSSISNLVPFVRPTKLLFLGDSITWLQPPYPWSWAYQMTNLFAFNNLLLFTNQAVNGGTIAHISSGFSTNVIANAPSAGQDAICFVMIGINDIRVGTSQTMATCTNWFADLNTIYYGIKTNGYRLCAFTIMDSVDVDTPEKERVRSLLNYWISTSTNIDWLIRADSILSDYANTNYFYDGLHPTNNGCQMLAKAVYQTIRNPAPFKDSAPNNQQDRLRWLFSDNTPVNIGGSNLPISLVTSNLGVSLLPALWLTNQTYATLGAQQASPLLMFGGSGYRSGNSSAMPVAMGFYNLPAQGSSANPLGSIVVLSSISNATPTSSGIVMYSSGAFGAGDITSSGNILAQSTSSLGHNSRSILKSPVDSAFQMMNNASTAFSYLLLGRLADDWLRLKVEASTNNPTLSIRTGADGNYASLVASNVLTSGFVSPTNGVVFQGKHAFSTNFTAIESIQLYNCNGTNIVITLPNCTNTTPWKIYRFSQTNSYASFTLTNANGLQTIHNGIDLSYSIRSAKQTAVYHDGAHWWLAVPDQPNFPNAQFSCSTNIPLTAANTAYPVTFNSTDFNNSLGIGLGLGTNGLHSKMWLTNSGVYEFGPSVVQSFNGNDTIRFWFRTFDTNVPASSTPSKGQNGSIRVITVPFVISVTQPTPVEIWAESDTTGESFPAEAASGNYPAAPCVICTVKMISHPWP